MDVTDIRLETPRLVLRPPRPDDAAAIVEGLSDFEVARFLTRVPFPYRLADAQSWLGALRPPQPGKAHFAIDLAGRLIGVVGIESELGYWLDRHQHGQGLMTEAAAALLDWHFAALPDDVVASGAHLGNAASLRVQEKLGFRDTGTRSMRIVRSLGREIEHVETRLVRADFERARTALRGPSWM